MADGRLADSGRGASSGPLDMQGETDGALLYYMSCREPGAGPGDRVLSDQATKEFYRRHMSALYARCRKICRRMGEPDSFAEDLANVTMAKAVRSHHTFVEGEDVASRATRTQAWLSQIALNLLRDKARNPLRSGPLTGVQDEIPFDDYSAEDFAALYCDGDRLPRDGETIRLVQAALSTLDERTHRVVVHTILQRQRSPKRSYAYRGSAEAFAKRLGTTTVNVRRIFADGVRAIAAYVDRNRRDAR